MATTYSYAGQTSFQRPVAMALALVSAVVLSPLYMGRRNYRDRWYDIQWNFGLIMPVVLAGLIIAIRTVSSTTTTSRRGDQGLAFLPSDPSWVLRIGSSSWGLAGVLIMLMLVLSWQDSVQHFLWR